MSLNELGRRIYFLKANGQFVFDTGESSGTNLTSTTPEQDFAIYTELNKYNKDEIGYINLQYGQHREDFRKCKSFRVNPETQELEFSFNNDAETNDPVYEKPLSVQLEETKKAIAELTLLVAGGTNV